MANKTVNHKPMQCHREVCQYVWTPKVKAPKKCPHCQNPLRRDKPRKSK